MAEPSNDDLYYREDGTEDAGWVREHYAWARSLPEEHRDAAITHLDATYNRAHEEARAEWGMSTELAAILRGAVDRRG